MNNSIAFEKFDNYLQLIRFDKPVGTILLWLPTAWALWIANAGLPDLSLIFYFFFGTFIMRSAGCIVNDLADRNIDPHVERTKKRPIGAKLISPQKGMVTLFLFLVSALLIVLQLPIECLYYSFFALFITILYPFCKRFFKAPQLILGLSFSMGIPMAVVASNAVWNQALTILFVLNFLWVFVYDTIYAIADLKDDLKIGVNSTAVLFGKYVRHVIIAIQITVHILWLVIGSLLNYSINFYLCWIVAGFVLFYQMTLIKNPDNCIKAFKSNIWYGSLMWLALF